MQGFADFAGADAHLARVAADHVAAFDFHVRLFAGWERAGAADADLDAFGHLLADEHVVGALHVVDDRLVKIVAGHAHAESHTEISASEIMATSVVPPPMSTIMLAVGSVTGRPAPIAAAMGSSTRKTRRAPARSADWITACFSTPVMPLGTAITTRGLT